MSNMERHVLLEGLKRSMNELYDNSTRRSVREEHKELARIIDRLRVLVDPRMPSSFRSSRSRSSVHSANIAVKAHEAQAHIMPTSHQRYDKESSSSIHSNNSTSTAKLRGPVGQRSIFEMFQKS